MYAASPDAAPIKKRFCDSLARIAAEDGAARTDAIDRFARGETLEELVAAIELDFAANKPRPTLDRLHTYGMKKFAHLLDTYKVAWTRDEPLPSRVGEYVKAIDQTFPLRDLSKQIIRNAISVFDTFNHVRINDSLAPDNTLPHDAEVRFIFDSITAIRRFAKTIEADSQAGRAHG